MSTTIETPHPYYDPEIHTFIAINAKFGGFGLSKEAETLIKDRIYDDESSSYRSSPKILSAFKQLGQKAADTFCLPVFCMVRKDLLEYYDIREYDGSEDLDFEAGRYLKLEVDSTCDVYEDCEELTKEDMIAELRKALRITKDGSDFPTLSLERFRVTYQEKE